jgi:hypothetical protein
MKKHSLYGPGIVSEVSEAADGFISMPNFHQCDLTKTVNIQDDCHNIAKVD